MTTIRATCFECSADVELTVDDLTLSLTPQVETGVYRYRCPSCGQVSRRPAGPRLVSILLACGVAREFPTPTASDLIKWAESWKTVRTIEDMNWSNTP